MGNWRTPRLIVAAVLATLASMPALGALDHVHAASADRVLDRPIEGPEFP